MTAQTTVPHAVIIGHPVAHARSPLLHSFWLREYGIEGRYSRADVRPEEVAGFLRGLPERGIIGGNVTVPNKEAAFLACDRTSEAARQIRAVNTFWFENGELVGDNTDGTGFRDHLAQTHPDALPQARRILVLGAGGAARGLALPLMDACPTAEFVFANRSSERLAALVADLREARPGLRLVALDWEDRARSLADTDILINSTSLGMKGQPGLDLELDAAQSRLIVADIVYVPLETPLLAAARRRGLRTLDGLGMLLHQAVPGFERWFGRRPEVTAGLRAHIEADLAAAVA